MLLTASLLALLALGNLSSQAAIGLPMHPNADDATPALHPRDPAISTSQHEEMQQASNTDGTSNAYAPLFWKKL